MRGVTRGDGTEGGEEGKGEGGERGEKEGGEIPVHGRTGPIKGRTRGPRGPKNILHHRCLSFSLYLCLSLYMSLYLSLYLSLSTRNAKK